MWPNIRRERRSGDHFNPVLQRVLEQIRQRHETIERLFRRSELDKLINIPVGASLVAKHASEERQPTNTEAPDLGLNSCNGRIASSQLRGGAERRELLPAAS